jgi:hypothetical protein
MKFAKTWRGRLRLPALCVAAGVLLNTSCGYHVAGKADLLPAKIKTIAVPAFGNATTRYKLAERLPAEITREFIERTRYRVVSSPEQADAVLTGALVNFFSYPTVFDPISGRATGIQVVAILQIALRERDTGAVLFNQPHLEYRERYEISVDPKAYFDETGGVMLRLGREISRSVVSAVLENF